MTDSTERPFVSVGDMAKDPMKRVALRRDVRGTITAVDRFADALLV